MHTIPTRRRAAAGLKWRRRAPRDNANRERDAEKPKKPKLKTHAARPSAADEAGKFLRGKAFKQHILSSKTTKRKRGLRGATTVAAVDTPKLARMLPYK
jgi:large subunit ribosomal protein L35